MDFFPRLAQIQKTKKTCLSVGLDPNPFMFPEGFAKTPKGIYDFLSPIVKATAPFASAFKPQIAYFSAFGAEDVLQQIISDIHTDHPDTLVVLDAKRGDIGSTAEMYAREVFERYKADGVTVNPYMGLDTVKPFTGFREKGVFLLCRTSNLSAKVTQDVKLDSGQSYFEFIADAAVQQWNTHENLGLVVGATVPEDLEKLRQQCPQMWFLVPGVGAQGGSLEQVLLKGGISDGGGVLVNSSRGILYKSQDSDFTAAAGKAAEKLQKEMARFL